MSRTGDAAPTGRPGPPRLAQRAWELFDDVELRGRWFYDAERDEYLRCRWFRRGGVVFRSAAGERVALPRRVAEQTTRLVRGPDDPRPPTPDQLPERLR